MPDPTFTDGSDVVTLTQPDGTWHALGGDDIVTGTSGQDTIYGDAGNDRLIGLGGADTLDGGSGIDTVDYSASTARVIVEFAYIDFQGSFHPVFTAGGDAEGDSLASIENVVGSNFNDLISGDNRDNMLAGLAGADSLNGRNGNDTADYSASDGRVVINLTTGYAAGGHAQGDTLLNMESLIGSNFDNDILTGNALRNTLAGLAGADTLDGQGGYDTADYSASDNRVVVNLTTAYAAGGHAQGDTLIGIENLIGSSYSNDILTGTPSDNVLAGLAGADTLDGRGGDDTADYSGSDGRVVVNLATGYAAGGHAQGDTLINIENLIGSNFDNDILAGTAAVNYMSGGAGTGDTVDYSASDGRVVINLGTGYAAGGYAQGDTLLNFENIIGSNFAQDILTGDFHDNVLTGGTGSDFFQFEGAFGHDIVTDFVDGDDNRLDVIGAGALVSSVNQSNGALFTFANGSTLLVLNNTVAQLSDDLFVI